MSRAVILDSSRRFRSELESHLVAAGLEILYSGHQLERGLSVLRGQSAQVVIVGGHDEAALLQFAKDAGPSLASRSGLIVLAPSSGAGVDKSAFARLSAVVFPRPESRPEFSVLASRAAAFGGGMSPPSKRQSSPTRQSVRTIQHLVAIVSSTGGPPALTRILGQLGPDFEPPILIVQHLPSGFDVGLSTNLSKELARPVLVAKEGTPLGPGTIAIAPCDKHVEVTTDDGVLTCRLRHGPPEVGCRPSGNRMLRSAARALGRGVIGVCLTGMGTDGADGMKSVATSGGLVIAQDEATSVVYGMPRAVAEAGVADLVIPLDRIAQAIKHRIFREQDRIRSA